MALIVVPFSAIKPMLNQIIKDCHCWLSRFLCCGYTDLFARTVCRWTACLLSPCLSGFDLFHCPWLHCTPGRHMSSFSLTAAWYGISRCNTGTVGGGYIATADHLHHFLLHDCFVCIHQVRGHQSHQWTDNTSAQKAEKACELPFFLCWMQISVALGQQEVKGWN